MSVECRLSEILKDKGIKISELERNVSVSRPTLQSLYDNKSQGIQFNTLETICDFLDITPNQLLAICSPKQNERRHLTILYIEQKEYEIELLKKLI